MQDLQGRIVVITGAASGIGAALARAFCAAGSRVVMADVDRAGCEAAATGLRDACPWWLDVTDARAVLDFAEAVEAEVGPVDVLVNCAGVIVLAEVVDTTLEDWRRLVDVNLFGTVHLLHAFLPRMYARRRGHVVNISSMVGLLPLASMGAYTATKHALVGLSETLAMEARARGVGVTLVCPWAVWTPFVQKLPVRGYDSSRAELLVRLIRPFCKDPDGLARLVVKYVRRDRLVLAHTFPGKLADLAHRASRRLFCSVSGVLYRQVVSRALRLPADQRDILG